MVASCSWYALATSTMNDRETNLGVEYVDDSYRSSIPNTCNGHDRFPPSSMHTNARKKRCHLLHAMRSP